MLSRRQPRPTASSGPTAGVGLGPRLSGGRALPTDPEGRVVWPLALMRRHGLILGASGTGKTETSMRIVEQLAAQTDAAIFYLDAKGDRVTAGRFCALMQAAGRTPRVFPNQPFDGWRGDWRAIVNRLLEVISFAESGPAAYYRDIAKTALQLACRHPDGPPRSSGELLHRLDYERLLDAHGPSTAALSLPRDRVSQVRVRYQSFFGQLGAQLDGDWAFEDTDCGYLMLDSVGLGEDAGSAASILFSDFAHFFTSRKSRERFCVMVCDEFAAISTASDLARKVEQARAFNTSLILVPQSLRGLGEPEQCDRILGSVETLFIHALNEPERLAELAGHQIVPEITHRIEDGAPIRSGLSRSIRRPLIRADSIRRLPVGHAWVVRRGRATRIAVSPAPSPPTAELPSARPIEPPLQRIEAAAPKKIAYLDEGD
jgi:hypothetical protein